MKTKENFTRINDDPTTDLDLSGVSLEKQYSKLSEHEKLLVASKLLGMNHLCVSIDRFLEDPYFLGSKEITDEGRSVFDIWRKSLREIFPSPLITKFPYISLSGCVGSGKSFMSKIMGLYFYHRLDCCRDVCKTMGMAGGTRFVFGFFHASELTSRKDFVQYYNTIFDKSPYFQNLYNNPNIRFIASGPRATGSVIGSQLLYCVLSEVGFWRPQDAKERVNEVLVRYNSRFVDKRNTFGGVVCDSSAKDADQGATELFEESVPKRELFRIAPAHWEARPELYKESNGKTFNFYKGDSKSLPRVIRDDEDLSKFDKDRIIKVPIQSKFMFINDSLRALRDLAGVPYTAKDLLFAGDLSHLINCSSIPNQAPEILEVDFFDKNDRIIDHVYNMISKIPVGTTVFVHYDIGLKKDICGVSLCVYDGEIVDPSGNSSYPKFKIPVLFGVSRKKGQSTSLDHLYQFLKDLIAEGLNVIFSADSFASAGLFQSCERDSIEYRCISIDRTPDAAYMFKNVVTAERIQLPYHNVLLRECSELRVLNNGQKIDHPIVSSCVDFDYKDAKGEMPGTKDIFDAAGGSLMSCYRKYSESLENGINTGYIKQSQIIQSLSKDARQEAQQVFQEMFESIF